MYEAMQQVVQQVVQQVADAVAEAMAVAVTDATAVVVRVVVLARAAAVGGRRSAADATRRVAAVGALRPRVAWSATHTLLLQSNIA